jgi:hypothetical protein
MRLPPSPQICLTLFRLQVPRTTLAFERQPCKGLSIIIVVTRHNHIRYSTACFRHKNKASLKKLYTSLANLRYCAGHCRPCRNAIAPGQHVPCTAVDLCPTIAVVSEHRGGKEEDHSRHHRWARWRRCWPCRRRGCPQMLPEESRYLPDSKW